MATTKTGAMTFARTLLLQSQIDYALLKILNLPKSSLEKIQLGIKNKWIKQIKIFGVDKNKLCYAEFVLEIDWNVHGLMIQNGKANVVIDGSWDNEKISAEINTQVTFFNAYISEYNLETRFSVRYTGLIDDNKVDEALGFSILKADGFKFANGPLISNRLTVKGLEELSVNLRIIDK